MPTVLVTPPVLRDLPSPTNILRRGGFSVLFSDSTGPLPSDPETLSGIEAVLAGMEPFDEAVLATMPRLRVIARVGVGYDAVDVPACTRRKVVVAITPGANHDSVAEQTLALLFGICKRVVDNHRTVVEGTFARRPTRPLRGQTLGILGLGRIGQAVARRALALGMRIVVHDPLIPAGSQHGELQCLSMEEVLRQSDIVSLHVPLDAQTHNMINADTMSWMKDGSILLNTARGGLVDEAVLAAALHSGKLAAAGLDVFEQEPPVGSALLTAPNVLFSPHVAGIDELGLLDMAEMAATTVVELHQGHWPRERLVNADLGISGWKWTDDQGR